MTTYAHMSLATLLVRHPWSVEVFDWHGVDIELEDKTLSVAALCQLRGLDRDRVERDLRAADPECVAWEPVVWRPVDVPISGEVPA